MYTERTPRTVRVRRESAGWSSDSHDARGELRTDLDHRVLAAQELDKAGDDSTFDDLFYGRVALFRQQFAEFGRRIELLIRLVREDALNHRWQLILEL